MYITLKVLNYFVLHFMNMNVLKCVNIIKSHCSVNKFKICIKSLGTNKASQVVVLNEDSVVVTQRKLM